MSASDVFAIAAHLHVLLRRKTGRVTDTEWMATNADYAREIVRYAREKAVDDGHHELLPWAEKLEALLPHMGETERRPLLVAAGERLRAVTVQAQTPAATASASGFLDSALTLMRRGGEPPPADGPGETRYVGRLR